MFSIITVNFNGEKFLKIFFDSLVNQSFNEYKLYFVDNNSVDNSLNIVDDYLNLLNIKVIKLEKNYGFAKANNIAIDLAMQDENDYIITLNNDVELDKNCLMNLNKIIQASNNSYDIFQILMINYYDRNIIDAAGIGINKYYYAYQIGYKDSMKNINDYKNDLIGACAGAAAYSKISLNEIKEQNGDYFDSSFFAYYEDVDLALRLLKIGRKTYLAKTALVYHIHSGTGIEGSAFKIYYLTRNLFLYLNKNLTIYEFKQFSYIYRINLIRTLLKYFITGKISLVKAVYKGYSDYEKIVNTKNKI
jgi:GT2 family glycosyltransferase